MNQQRIRRFILVSILFSLLTLLFPYFSFAITLNGATNITHNSIDLGWSMSSSPNFSRYEIYQALGPINDPPAVSQVPTLSEWFMLAFLFFLILIGLFFLRRRHKIVGMGLIFLVLSAVAYGVITLSPIATITNIAQTSLHVSNLTPNTMHYFRVCAYYTDGSYDLSNQITAQTLVTPTLPSISSFSANPGTINLGQSSTLSWNITNATSASIDHGVGSVSPATGSINVSPLTTTTYTLTATNGAGSVTAQATVTVIVPPTINSFSTNPGTINLGQSSTLS